METHRESVDPVADDVVRSFARAAILAALLGATAPVSIPIPISPVPITLQVLFVFLAGLYLGPVWGPFSVLLYLTAGAVGLPVFAEMKSGIGILFGQTGGYLWGYVVAAWLIGVMVHRGTELRDPAEQPLPIVVVALVASMVVIYGMGVGYMAWLLELELLEAVAMGMVPFLVGDLLKMVAAVAIVKSKRITQVRP
ncbi:biotin transporter BioY [Natrarchaeobius chitinivorans]|uniref:Biotin transporter BioY n=1 Tax=Natrarchaeobius chitinivorans TaxID=1679083 RepID=A0A3N6MKW5_NATCH|nr:biotin transporter BioY [Natrarchaeobius chitinivorans]RQG97900.1 biotin transporter BioY [Natrarchaeobius chitinivorans]